MRSSSSEYQLEAATDIAILSVKAWFSNQQQLFSWGGPNMSYPMSDRAFLTILREPQLNSFCLFNADGQLLAFGQFYLRLERHHLGRLAVNPLFRNKGLAKILIASLLEKAQQKLGMRAASLFVFKDNDAALRCYLAMGFNEQSYPEGIPNNMPNCMYMVRT